MCTGNTISIDANNVASAVYPCVYREHNHFRRQYADYFGLSLCIVYREHLNMASKRSKSCGLSLCIQGTFKSILDQSISQRFIPVYTGNITSRMRFSVWCTVYPCVYREHHQEYCYRCHLNGLSLCIQGTFFLRLKLRFLNRFIPVYTGNIVNPS